MGAEQVSHMACTRRVLQLLIDGGALQGLAYHGLQILLLRLHCLLNAVCDLEGSIGLALVFVPDFAGTQGDGQSCQHYLKKAVLAFEQGEYVLAQIKGGWIDHEQV